MAQRLEQLRSGQAADLLARMDPSAAANRVAEADPAKAGTILTALPPATAAVLLATLEMARATAVVETMEASAIAHMLVECEPTFAATLLAEMSPASSAPSSLRSPEPVVEFAQALQQMRVQAGSPSLRELAKRANVSMSRLYEVFRGRYFPRWATVEAVVRACNGDLATWRRNWERIASALEAERKPQRRTPARAADVLKEMDPARANALRSILDDHQRGAGGPTDR